MTYYRHHLDELFCSIPDNDLPSYHDHTWNGTELIYTTGEGITLRIEMNRDETARTMADKIQIAYDEAIEALEDETREWEALARYEQPGSTTHWSSSLRCGMSRPDTGYVFEIVFC